MSEDNKSMEEIVAISYFDTDNMDIKNHIDRYFKIKRDIINVLNKYNVMWVLTDTNEFNNKDKEIEKLNNIINEFEEELKWQRKVCLSLNEGFAISRIDTLINKLQELKGSDKE